MNKKIIIIVISIILSIILIVLGILFIDKEEEPSIPSNPNVSTPVDEKEPTLSIEDRGNIIETLTSYGIKMYEDKSYLKLNSNDEYYYITLGELKTKGYNDIVEYLYSCNDNDKIIYFYKDTSLFEQYPITISYFCGPQHK